MNRATHLTLWAIGFLILTLSDVGLGQERWTHFGLRPLGMGNAFVAVADDHNALFYNPAGLARLKDWEEEFLNPYLSISKNTRDFIGDAQKLSDAGNDSDKQTIELIENNSGKNQYFAIGMTPYLILKNFGIGIAAELLSASMVFHRYPSVNLDVGPRIIVPVAFALNFLEDRLSVGFGVKYRLRGGINHEFSIQDLEAFKNDDKNGGTNTGPKLEDYVEGGSGIGTDIGILFTPVKTMEPTIGLSVTDLGGTGYKKMDIGGNAVAAPERELPSVNMGFSIKPLQSGRTYLLAAVDVHSINQPYSFSKKLNLGTEFGFGELFKVQAGLHQGYMSGGFEFDVGRLAVRGLTYAEELGRVAGTTEDRRYAVQLHLLL